MPRATTTHTLEWTLADPPERDITVHYSYHPGAPERGPTYACGGTPADPPEIWIEVVRNAYGVPIELTDAEGAAIVAWIAENPPEPDYPDDERDYSDGEA